MFFNIYPVFLYAQEGGNSLLQLYIPLCLTGLMGLAAFSLSLISLTMKDKND
jgi:hypothetical protein